MPMNSQEHGTTAESLGKLRAAFDKQGSVTPGNASGLNDGAAILVVTTRSHAEKLGLTPLAKVAAYANAGVDPKIMGTGPIPATQRLFGKSKLERKRSGFD